MSEELKPCPVCGGFGQEIDNHYKPNTAHCLNPTCPIDHVTILLSMWNSRPIEDRLRKALRFYAKEKHCGTSKEKLMRSDCYVVEEGEIAREALKLTGEE